MTTEPARPPLRDASELLLPAVRAAIASLTVTEPDQAMVKLAERYAAVIDTARDPAWALRWIGPLLQDALTALGASPAARAALSKAEPPTRVGTESGLARLRAAR